MFAFLANKKERKSFFQKNKSLGANILNVNTAHLQL